MLHLLAPLDINGTVPYSGEFVHRLVTSFIFFIFYSSPIGAPTSRHSACSLVAAHGAGHLQVDAQNIAFADRNKWIGDADFEAAQDDLDTTLFYSGSVSDSILGVGCAATGASRPRLRSTTQ